MRVGDETWQISLSPCHRMPYDSRSEGALNDVAWQVSLAKSQDAI